MIQTPTMRDFLCGEFMEPMRISAYRLAAEIGVPASRIQDILHGRRKVTVDTSLRLGKFFGMSEKFFLDLQNDIDLRNEKQRLKDQLQRIQPYQFVRKNEQRK